MKKIFYLIILCSFVSFGQTRKDKMQSIRIAYITTELSLTQEETTRFLPLLSEYDNKQQELRKKMRVIIKKINSFDELNDSEALETLNTLEKIELDLFNNRKNLINNMKSFLSSKKILKFRQIELDYNKKLIEKIKERN
jgi:hypothetical protein